MDRDATESGNIEDRDERNVHQLYGNMQMMMTTMHEYSPIDTTYPTNPNVTMLDPSSSS